MFCKSCGTQLPDGSAFCPTCGTAQSSTPQPAPNPSNPTYEPSYDTAQFHTPLNNSPVVSTTPVLVFGILALSFACTFWLSFLGIIFGAISQSKSKAVLVSNGTLSGKARTGHILGKIGLILGIVLTAIVVTIIVIALVEVFTEEIFYESPYDYYDDYNYYF